MTYKAFVSYSHAADGKLAPTLQTALHRFAKPWYRLRAMHVFRDKTSLAMTSELWPSIEAALEQSEHFLLLASPPAAQSEWVQKEVTWWLEARAPKSLLSAREEVARPRLFVSRDLAGRPPPFDFMLWVQ